MFRSWYSVCKNRRYYACTEATHAIKGAVDEALKCKAEGKSKSILFNLCGHGHFDMQAYMDYFSGELAEDSFDAKAFEESLSAIPAVN